jgi:excisionase family DNA binding protein
VESGESSLNRKLASVTQSWLDRARLFEEHESGEAAAAYRRASEELEFALKEWEDELLTIEQAAEESGYSEDHLRELVRESKLPAERADGKKSRIKLRRRDLPRKPGKRGISAPVQELVDHVLANRQ